LEQLQMTVQDFGTAADDCSRFWNSCR